MQIRTKLLMTGALCLLLATGCSFDVTDRHTTDYQSLSMSILDETTVNISPAILDPASLEVIPTPLLTEKEYEQRIVAYQKDFTEAFNQLAQMLEGRWSEIDSVWLEKQAQQINEIHMIMMQYRSLTPPESHQEIQDKYIEAMDKFEEGLRIYRQGYAEGSSQVIESSRAVLKKGQDLWNYAYSRLLITTVVPIENGRMTSNDLKEMDRMVGIDRDSVMLNVSEDGRELIGHWGSYDKSGQVKPIIVLHAQHSYEKFGKGEYPDMSNAMFGRWEYDYLTGIVTIDVHAIYKDGKSNGQVGRKQLRYEVQRFKDNEIQFMDLDTLETFEYTLATAQW